MPSTECGSSISLLAAGIAIFAMAAIPAHGARAFSDKYAGSQTCETCHEDIYDNLLKSPHGMAEKGAAAGPKGEWKDHACEGCHGPGAQHASSANPADIRNPAKLTPQQVDETCLGCHTAQQTHAGRLISGHARNGISCIACHKMHADNGHALIVRSNAAINEQCSGCHVNIWASFQKPYGHRLVQNAMNCVDCHNPHGSFKQAMGQVFAANEAACIACHGDLRGPFTFDHAVVRFEGCNACHEPHGSVNPRMLTRAEVRFVCLECHANLPPPNNKNGALGVVPASFHDLRSPVFQNCTVCHQKIHGSYTDRFLIR